MDNNKFKPIQRPTYNSGNSTNSYRPTYGQPQNQPTPQSQQVEYQQPVEQNNYQEEYNAPSQNYKTPKSSGNKKMVIGIIAVIAIIAVVVGIFAFGGNKGVDKVDNVLEETTPVGTSSSLLSGQTTGGFNGSAVEVPWPSDITPTKMEINLDPTTGEPVLMLVGEKSGVGTVIRSYNKAGALTGFWVIVSSDPALTDTTNNNSGNTVTGSTPTLEQTIADEVHTYLGGKIEGKSTNDIIKDYNTELTATATKYGKTVEQVLNYYFVATGLTPAN